MDRKIALTLQKLGNRGSDPEVARARYEDMERWICRGIDDEQVIDACISIRQLATIELARGGLRAMRSDPGLAWSLLSDWVSAMHLATFASRGWRGSRGIESPLTTSVNSIGLLWAAAFVVSDERAEADFGRLLLSPALMEYVLLSGSRSDGAPAQFCAFECLAAASVFGIPLPQHVLLWFETQPSLGTRPPWLIGMEDKLLRWVHLGVQQYTPRSVTEHGAGEP